MPGTTPSVPHRAAEEDTVVLADPAQGRDLATLLSRARALDPEAAVRLQARGAVLAAWVPVLSGETLLDRVPTVVGMRAVHLAAPAPSISSPSSPPSQAGADQELDVTVEAAAVLDRLARLERTEGRLVLPPVSVTPVWAGTLPVRGPWSPAGTVSAEEVETTSRTGVQAVERALPAQAGAAVLSTVRSRIWGTLTPEGFVAGAAFGATALGFNGSARPSKDGAAEDITDDITAATIEDTTDVRRTDERRAGESRGEQGPWRIWRQGPWTRISNRAGHVVSRQAPAL